MADRRTYLGRHRGRPADLFGAAGAVMARRLLGWRDVAWGFVAVLLALTLGWVVHEINLGREQRDALVAALESEQDATRQRGETPVAPEPSELMKDPSLKGDPGRGITDVAAEGCSLRIRFSDDTNRLVGPFCGPTGSRGPTGSPGPRGSPGPDGVSITDARSDGCDILIFFSNGETRRVGPFCGPPGEDGEDGRNGRSLIGMDCVGQGRESDWKLTWREPDGSITEDTIDGPCRVSDPNDPSPTPPPIEGD